MSGPNLVMCTYRVSKEKEGDFRDLISRHWSVLREQELVTDTPNQVVRGEAPEGSPFFVETFEWVTAQAPETAHHAPPVAAIWEKMGICCEPRGGLPAMEFHPVELIC